jgi:endonuclease/exonuclease/phosphatase family metal-dependent hydrolase
MPCHFVKLLLLTASLAVLQTCESPAVEHQTGQDSPREIVRILAYNIHHGEGMDEQLDLERIAALIAELEPDLVALQEVDRLVERTGFVDQAAVLGELTGLTPAFGDFMPYQDGDYGMAVLSRWPVVSVTNHRLPDGDEPRSALAVRVRSPVSERELEFVGIHLYRTADERLAQAQRLAEHLDSTAVPVILAGDFNSEPDSEVVGFLSRTWRFIDKGDDRFTFSSFAPEKEIDFVAYRPTDAFSVAGQRLLDEPVASDHRPVFVELRW